MLIDGDGRGEAGDRFHSGPAGFLQELSGIRGEGGQVAALGFPEDHIEHQRRLPGTGDPGDDNQLVFGNIQGYRTEIVLRGIPYRYLIMPLHPMDLSAKIGKKSKKKTVIADSLFSEDIMAGIRKSSVFPPLAEICVRLTIYEYRMVRALRSRFS